jgi:uncharacterized membrane protein
MFIVLLGAKASIYVFAGVMHFLKPRMFIRIIPPFVPNPVLINKLTGVAEIILGLGLLLESTRTFSAIGIIILLVAVFPANIYMYQIGAKGIPKWMLLARLPLQFLLMAWAYLYI